MGSGHHHIELDQSLINMICGPGSSISMLDVAPGKRTVQFIPAANDHADDMKAMKQISFAYKPAHPLAAVKPLSFAGKPSMSVVPPKSGATVHMVDPSGSCRARFNLLGGRSWARFWVTPPGQPDTVVASTAAPAVAGLRDWKERSLELAPGDDPRRELAEPRAGVVADERLAAEMLPARLALAVVITRAQLRRLSLVPNESARPRTRRSKATAV